MGKQLLRGLWLVRTVTVDHRSHLSLRRSRDPWTSYYTSINHSRVIQRPLHWPSSPAIAGIASDRMSHARDMSAARHT